jgi:hypothetical protein
MRWGEIDDMTPQYKIVFGMDGAYIVYETLVSPTTGPFYRTVGDYETEEHARLVVQSLVERSRRVPKVWYFDKNGNEVQG